MVVDGEKLGFNYLLSNNDRIFEFNGIDYISLT